MKSILMIGLACLLLSMPGRAFDLYGAQIGMSLSEVQDTLPKDWRLKELVDTMGGYTVEDRRTGKAPDARLYWFCKEFDQLAAVDNILSFNKHFAPLTKRYISELGKPTNVSVTHDELFPNELERVSLEWTQGQETLSVSASILKNPKRGHEMPYAVIKLQGLSKCHSEYWERKDRSSAKQSPFGKNAG